MKEIRRPPYTWARVTVAALAITMARRVSQAQTRPSGEDKGASTPVVVIASIDAYWSADQYAKDSGYITEVLADIGDHVKKGQVLAVIDDPELQRQLVGAQAALVVKEEMVKAADATAQQAQAAIEVAKSQLVGLQADLKLAQVTLQRQEELFTGKAITNQQLDDTRDKAEVASAAVDVGKTKLAAAQADLLAAGANRAVAAAQVNVAAAEVQRVQTLLQYTKIVAPFDGVVTRRMVNPGDLAQVATANRTAALFTCQRLDLVRVFCEVPEVHAATVQVGDQADVQITGAGGRIIHGKITRIAASVQQQSRTMRTEIDLENPDEKLLPGTYAQVTIMPGSAGLPR
jgi:multidrug resistance efflux pump